jgi:hypothetical protein
MSSWLGVSTQFQQIWTFPEIVDEHVVFLSATRHIHGRDSDQMTRAVTLGNRKKKLDTTSQNPPATI